MGAKIPPALRIALLMATELLKRDNRENTASILEVFVRELAEQHRQLLTALEKLLATRPGHSDERNQAIAEAEVAIAKARGE